MDHGQIWPKTTVHRPCTGLEPSCLHATVVQCAHRWRAAHRQPGTTRARQSAPATS